MRNDLLMVAVASIAGLVVWLLRARSPRVTDVDLLVLQELERAGSDLSKPHAVEFFVYLPTEQAAATAAGELRKTGFAADVQQGADDENWLCLATQTLVPAHAELVAIRARLAALAASLGGKYDGWGTEIVP